MKLTKNVVLSLVLGLLVGAGLLVALGSEALPKHKGSSEEVVTLSKSNTLVLSDEINGENAAAVIYKAKELNSIHFSGKKPIHLFLNTPGGSIQTGLELIETLHGIGRPVDTITLFSASMGFQIAQNLGERMILKNG